MADREIVGPVRFRMHLGDEESSAVPLDTEFLRLLFWLQVAALEQLQLHSRDIVSPTRAQLKLALQKILSEMPAKAQQQVRSNVLFFPIRFDFRPTERLPPRRVKPYLRETAKLIEELMQTSRESYTSVFDTDHGVDAFPFVFESIALEVQWFRMVPGAPALLIEIAELSAHVHEEMSKVEFGHVSTLWQLTPGEMGGGDVVRVCEPLHSARSENGRPHSSELHKCTPLLTLGHPLGEAEAELVFLKTGVSVKVSPYIDQFGDTEFLELKTSGAFHIIRNEKRLDSVDIVVPCFGYCSVPRDFIDCFLKHRLGPSKVYRGSILTLELRINGEPDETFVLPLLRFPGSKLKSLTLSGYEMTSETFGYILKICPRLEKFAVSIVEDPAEYELLEAYNKRGCQLLSVQIVRFEPNDYTKHFIWSLENQKSAAAIKLRELKLSSEEFTRRQLVAFVRMLEIDKTLKVLELIAPSEEQEDLEPHFKRFNGQALRGRVPLPCRHALLSVIKRLGEHARGDSTLEAPARKRPRLTGAVDRLNGQGQDVMAMIFQFAEEPRVRRVRVHWSNYDY